MGEISRFIIAFAHSLQPIYVEMILVRLEKKRWKNSRLFPVTRDEVKDSLVFCVNFTFLSLNTAVKVSKGSFFKYQSFNYASVTFNLTQTSFLCYNSFLL